MLYIYFYRNFFVNKLSIFSILLWLIVNSNVVIIYSLYRTVSLLIRISTIERTNWWEFWLMKMAFYKTIKVYLAQCSYYPNQTNSFNGKRLLAILAAFLIVASHFLFLFYEADNVVEYVSSAYLSSTTLGFLLSLIDTTLHTEAIFKLIDNNIEEMSKMSE